MHEEAGGGLKVSIFPPVEKMGRYFILGLYMFALVFMIKNFDSGFNIGDEGVALMGAWRIFTGQVPHRDFFEIIPPFSFFPTAFFFRLFGVGIMAERLLVLIYGMALIATVDRLLTRFGAGAWERCLAVSFLIPFGVFYWPMPSHHWVVDILQMLALLSLLNALEGRRRLLWGCAAGAMCSLGAFSLQDQGGYFIAALCALFFPWIQDINIRKRVFAGWVIGGVAVASVFAIYLLPRVSPSELLYQWFSFPASRYRNVQGNSTGLFSGWEELLAVWKMPHSNLVSIYAVTLTAASGFLALLPPLAIFTPAWGFASRWLSRERAGLLASAVLAALGTAMHRWAITNLVWAAPPMIVACGLLLGRWGKSDRRSLVLFARSTTAVLIICCLCFAAIYFHFSSLSNPVRLTTRAGTVRSVLKDESGSFQQAFAAIEHFVPEDGALFVDGYMPLMNFLAQRPNPTRFNFFYYPKYHTEAQRAEVTRVLESRPCYILAALPRDPSNPFDVYLHSRYDVVWSNKKAILYSPRSTAFTATR